MDKRSQHGSNTGSHSGWEECNSCSDLGFFFLSHGCHIPAANTAAERGVVAVAGSVTVATTAALTTEARGRVPFAEGPPAFITANQQIGRGAALHTGEG